MASLSASAPVSVSARAVPLLLLALSACSAPALDATTQPTAAAALAARPTAAPATAAADPPAPPPPALPAALAPPRPACVVRGRGWRNVGQPMALYSDPAGSPFAAAWAGQAELVFAAGVTLRKPGNIRHVAGPLAESPYAGILGGPAEPSTPSTPANLVGAAPFLRIETELLSLSGFVTRDEARVAPARALVLGQVIVPAPGPHLEVVSVSEAGVHLSPSWITADEARLDPELVIDPVPCDALTLDVLPFDARAPFGRSIRAAAIPSGRVVPLSAEPGGAPAVHLTAPGVEREVEVVASRGAQSRIVLTMSRGWLVGWVATAALVNQRHQAFGMTGLGNDAAPKLSEPIIRAVCAEDVPLIASGPDGPRVVGVARAGAVIELLDRGVGLRKARVRAKGAATGDDGTVSVREVDVDRCERRTTAAP